MWEKELEMAKKGEDTEERSVAAAFELGKRVREKCLKIKKHKKDITSTIGLPPALPTTTAQTTHGKRAPSSAPAPSPSPASASASSSAPSRAQGRAKPSGSWFGGTVKGVKALPTAAQCEGAEASVSALLLQDHYAPGLTIDDPEEPGQITLANPAVISNWNGRRFENRARFVNGTKDGEGNLVVWEYELRSVSAALRSAKSKGEGKGESALEDAADPLGDDADDNDGDGEHDADGGLESEPGSALRANKGKGKGRYHSGLDTDEDSDSDVEGEREREERHCSSDESEGDYHDSGAE